MKYQKLSVHSLSHIHTITDTAAHLWITLLRLLRVHVSELVGWKVQVVLVLMLNSLV